MLLIHSGVKPGLIPALRPAYYPAYICMNIYIHDSIYISINSLNRHTYIIHYHTYKIMNTKNLRTVIRAFAPVNEADIKAVMEYNTIKADIDKSGLSAVSIIERARLCEYLSGALLSMLRSAGRYTDRLSAAVLFKELYDNLLLNIIGLNDVINGRRVKTNSPAVLLCEIDNHIEAAYPAAP